MGDIIYKQPIRGVNYTDEELKAINQDFNDFAYIVQTTENKDGSRARATKYGGLSVLNKAPYTTVYNHLKRMQNDIIPDLLDDDIKSGNGLKKMNKIFKRRVY
jgi:hypothetical protein